MEITLSVRKIGIAVKPGPTIAAGFPNHGHARKSVLDALSDNAGKLLYNGQMIQGGGADPLSFYQTYGYVQISGAFGGDGNPDAPTQTRINALVALGVPQTVILVAVVSVTSTGVLTADNATSAPSAGPAELVIPGAIGSDNATSTSTAGSAELTPQGSIGADNVVSSSAADTAALVGVLLVDNATSTSTAQTAGMSASTTVPSITVFFGEMGPRPISSTHFGYFS